MEDLGLIQQEFIKCMRDTTRIYMIETYLKTYDMRKRREVPFVLFPRQKDFLQALRDYQNNVTTKPRQAGITTTTAGFLACEVTLADPSSPETILVIGNKLDLSQQMVYKIRKFLEQIPRWFWGEDYYSPDPKSAKNKKDIFVTCNKNELELFNGCKIIARSSGENAARGVSAVSWLVFDEAAFIEKGDVVFAQAVATTSTGGHIIMISTPCGHDPLYYKTYSQAKLPPTDPNSNGFHLTELKWYQDPRYNKFLKWTKKDKETGNVEIDEEEIIDNDGSIKYNEARWKRLEERGFKPTSPWYVNMCGKFNNDEQKIAQELDVSFLGSANNVVPPEIIEMQEKMNKRDPDPELKDPFVEETWIWKPPIEGHRYVMAIDAARGDGADKTAIEIIDIDAIDENGVPCYEQVLEYHSKAFGDIVGEFAYNYGTMYGNAFAIVDCIGGTGDSIVLKLLELGYTNLFYDDNTLNKYLTQTTTKLSRNTEGKLPGFHSPGVRFQMLSNLANLIKTNTLKMRSSRAIGELNTWIYKNGRQDHQDGAHDDTLTAMAMGLFVMQYSLNKLEATKSKDIAILKSWVMSTSSPRPSQVHQTTITMTPSNKLPFHNQETLNKQNNVGGQFLWLFGRH